MEDVVEGYTDTGIPVPGVGHFYNCDKSQRVESMTGLVSTELQMYLIQITLPKCTTECLELYKGRKLS